MAKTLQQLIDERLGTPTGQSGRATTVSVSTTTTVILPADQNRIAAVVVNLGSNPIFMTPVGVPSTINGIQLGASGGSMVMLWDEDLYLLGREWAGVTDAGTSTVLRLEVLTI